MVDITSTKWSKQNITNMGQPTPCASRHDALRTQLRWYPYKKMYNLNLFMMKYQTNEGHSTLKECTCSLQKRPGQKIQRKAQGVFRIKGN